MVPSRLPAPYTPSLSQLTISGMPTHLHDALTVFSKNLFRQLDSPKQRVFTPNELNKIHPNTTNVPLPGITRRRTAAGATRTKQPAYMKIPDFALNYGNRTFPQVIFEVGWATEEKHAVKYAEGISPDNTVQDEPTWSISTTRGFLSSEKTANERAERAEHEYQIFGHIRSELYNFPEGQVSSRPDLIPGDFSNIATVFTGDCNDTLGGLGYSLERRVATPIAAQDLGSPSEWEVRARD
ncbi:hypothetical protein L211DRAFT_849319 [Terfezia boudieri ATCC MYA-4762]|uniref:Uncharacterized protein n=1 Tax=Terfezia boudieri ATCC MYA-4762 TaxID=1051890 RepID=A0A3N4LMY8_9PEZI|nr:hypothetical protein L211DRAFT_849319 [Terfezia boudieri ATCC MYA-4762]